MRHKAINGCDARNDAAFHRSVIDTCGGFKACVSRAWSLVVPQRRSAHEGLVHLEASRYIDASLSGWCCIIADFPVQ